MCTNELLYQMALTRVPQVGDVQARLLLQRFGSAAAVFKARKSQLERLEGIGSVRAENICRFSGFAVAETEIAFMERYQIEPLSITNPAYPQRLLHCADAPLLLFYKGSANLNAPRVLSIVGTRYPSEYGKRFTETLVAELAAYGITIVSGLAFGIDAIAHKAALHNQLPTVGVVGHGLDRIYPRVNDGLAKTMLQEGGGLLTEFWSGTEPDKHNFPLRNRIVAGMADATLVIETDIRGGSMITAHLADGYNRDVYALPGRVTDLKSRGCNHLIQHHRAAMLTDARQLLLALGWHDTPQKKKSVQPTLFAELTDDERTVLNLLGEKEAMHIDELNLRSTLSSSALAAAILNLELNNRVQSLPGKMYKMNQ